MADISREEAINEILSWTPTLLSIGKKCTNKTMTAQKMAISDMKRVEKLEAENKRLKEGIEKLRSNIKKLPNVNPSHYFYDVIHRDSVLEELDKYSRENVSHSENK